MEQVILCQGAVGVAIYSDCHRAELSISQQDELRFPLTAQNLAQILAGETIQFSHKGIFCKLTRYGDKISIVFAWRGVHDSAECDAMLLENVYWRIQANDATVVN